MLVSELVPGGQLDVLTRLDFDVPLESPVEARLDEWWARLTQDCSLLAF